MISIDSILGVRGLFIETNMFGLKDSSVWSDSWGIYT